MPTIIMPPNIDYKICKLALPSTIYGVVGRELNIYFDNLMIDDAAKYQFETSCTIGTHQNERWTCVPLIAGTYPLTIKAYKDYSEAPIATATTNVVVTDFAVGAALSKKLLAIGDSTTLALATNNTLSGSSSVFYGGPMTVTLLGTQGSAPALCEGHSGQTVNWFKTNASSPFVFSGTFNFSSYMSAHSYTEVDFVTIHLGINDVISCLSDAAVNTLANTAMGQLEDMITNIHAFNSSVKIAILLTIPPSYYQDAFGISTPSGTRNIQRFRHKRNVLTWVFRLLSQFKDREAGNIYVLPFNACIDTVNNMYYAASALANSRSTASITRQSNYVHPATSGDYQMSDTIYYWMKAMIDTGQTNQIPLASRDFITSWTATNGGTYTVTGNQSDPDYGKTAYRIVYNADASGSSTYYYPIYGAPNPHHSTFSIMAKLNSGVCYIQESGTMKQITSGEWVNLQVTNTNLASASYSVGFTSQAAAQAFDITVCSPVAVNRAV
jgi:lysophospholipase L1-like esterase